MSAGQCRCSPCWALSRTPSGCPPPPKIVKLAAHSPYLTMIKHGLPESDARPSSRSFFLFLFSARDSFCLFEAIFEKLNLNVKGRQAAERKGPTASSGS